MGTLAWHGSSGPGTGTEFDVGRRRLGHDTVTLVCRQARYSMTDTQITERIFELLSKRQPGATICPSEVARSLAPNGASWRGQMPQVRQVAQALARQQRLCVTRGGVPVDATAPGGPIRLGLFSK